MPRLVIVESPAKARTIAGYLGRDFVVESSVGHIRDLPRRASDVKKADKPRFGTLGVDVERGFEPLYVVDEDKKRVVSDLRKKLASSDELLLATDEDREGEAIAEAGAVVLANAADALRLAPSEHIRLRRVRGQLTHLPPLGALRCVLLRGGMVLPPIEGVTVTGASFDLDDADPSVRAESHEGNLARLERIVPGASAGFDPRQLAGRTSFRTVARDRLPLIGPLEQAQGLYGALAYGSRGLLWAGLGAELLASQMEGEPLPLEVALADALAPARFARKARRRAGSTGSRP